MPLTLASGPSISDYPREEIIQLAKMTYTIGTNFTCKDFPCDMVVVLDPLLMDKPLLKFLQDYGRPIVCRKWEGQDKLGLDLIEISNESISKYPLSGMCAVKLGDALAAQTGGRPNYVLGVDASKGNYSGYQGTVKGFDNYDKNDIKLYESLNLHNTINLSVHSRVPYWPKQSKLPNWKKLIISPELRIITGAWVKAHAKEILS